MVRIVVGVAAVVGVGLWLWLVMSVPSPSRGVSFSVKEISDHVGATASGAPFAWSPPS
jgi:hypothetical protein